MYDNSNCPVGADNEHAPWNEENKEKDYTAKASYTLAKVVNLRTSYIDIDDCAIDPRVDFESQHLTPIELLRELRQYVERDILTSSNAAHIRYLRNMLEDVDGWIADDVNVDEL